MEAKAICGRGGNFFTVLAATGNQSRPRLIAKAVGKEHEDGQLPKVGRVRPFSQNAFCGCAFSQRFDAPPHPAALGINAPDADVDFPRRHRPVSSLLPLCSRAGGHAPTLCFRRKDAAGAGDYAAGAAFRHGRLGPPSARVIQQNPMPSSSKRTWDFFRLYIFLLSIFFVTGEYSHTARRRPSSSLRAFLLSFSRGINLVMQSHPFRNCFCWGGRKGQPPRAVQSRRLKRPFSGKTAAFPSRFRNASRLRPFAKDSSTGKTRAGRPL